MKRKETICELISQMIKSPKANQLRKQRYRKQSHHTTINKLRWKIPKKIAPARNATHIQGIRKHMIVLIRFRVRLISTIPSVARALVPCSPTI